MWSPMILVLLGMVSSALSTLKYGPCQKVTTVDLDTKEWPGIYYVNVMTHNVGATCLWVNRTLNYADGNSANTAKENVLIAEVFSRFENGTKVESAVEGSYVGKGNYKFSKELTCQMLCLKKKLSKWCRMFNSGRTNYHDETRPGVLTLIDEHLKTQVDYHVKVYLT